MSVMEPGIKPDEMELKAADANELGDVIRERHLENITPAPDLPLADQAPNADLPSSLTSEDLTGIKAMEQSADGVEPPATTNRVKDSKILDLRAVNNTDYSARRANLQKLYNANEPVASADALDRQGIPNPSVDQVVKTDDQAPAVTPIAEAKEKGFVAKAADKASEVFNTLLGKK